MHVGTSGNSADSNIHVQSKKGNIASWSAKNNIILCRRVFLAAPFLASPFADM
jgi:hypothetical protein